jgi:hypothetical protein
MSSEMIRALLVLTQPARIPFGKVLLLRYHTGSVVRRDPEAETLMVRNMAFKQARGGVR